MIELDALEGKSVALLGRPKNFSLVELKELLELDRIRLTQTIEDDAALVIKGRILSPLQEEEIDSIEAEKRFPTVTIEAFESAVAQSIHQEGLYISLKLSADNERILSYLTNSLISDEIFIKLLPLFDWAGESLFENDANRDLSAAITRRFYSDIEHNHNIEYSPMGILETVGRSSNTQLLDAIFALEPIQKGVKGESKSVEHQIVQAMVLNEHLSTATLKAIAQKGDARLAPFIAASSALDDTTASLLLQQPDEQTLLQLAANKCLGKELKRELLQSYPEHAAIAAAEMVMDEGLFDEMLQEIGRYPEVGANRSLTPQMIQRLLDLKDLRVDTFLAGNGVVDAATLSSLCDSSDREILASLASNESLPLPCMQKLFALDDEVIHLKLAQNSATDPKMLQELATKDEVIVKAVAANSTTPVETLYQLHLDMRYNALVKANPAFGAHIQQDIGW